jgi:lysyl-tRNA synthetase class I
MKEFLFELLQAVATAAVPVCAAFLVQFLRRKSKEAAAQTNSLTTKELLAEVTEAVTTAVTYTSQTYVDALKKNGIFDKDAQLEALQKSKNKTLSLLSASAKSILAEIYGDLDAYLETRIEAEVKNQKGSDSVAFSIPLEAVEGVKEGPDAVAVAAATAAATVAATEAAKSAIPQAAHVQCPDGPQEGNEATGA